MPRSAKRRVLRVARVALRAAAIPAIWTSRISTDRPTCRCLTAIAAAVTAAVRSNGSTRPSRISSMARSKAAKSRSRRRPGARSARPKRISKIVIVVVQIASGGCASSQRSTAGSTATRIVAESTLVSTTIIRIWLALEFGRLCRLTTPFGDVLFEPDISEKSAQALAERLCFSRLGANGGAQDFAHFLLGAPTMLSGTLLELRLNVVLEVADNQLSHNMPPV